MPKPCAVFISSTVEDLREFRLAARDAILAAGLQPIMMEYFPARGVPPLDECLERVSPCELLLVLSARRYGWIPTDQSGAAAKSITWLECEQAARNGKDIIVFFLDQKTPWPVEQTEAYRLTAAFNEGTFTAELPA